MTKATVALPPFRSEFRTSTPNVNLTTEDEAAFERRFINLDMLTDAGIRRVGDIEGADKVGRKRKGGTSYAGLLIPFRYPGDVEPREYQLRRDTPDYEQHNGTVKEKGKYVFPPGRGNILYFTPEATVADLLNIDLPVIFVEGAWKALATQELCNQAGYKYLVIALTGVWNWRGKIGKVDTPNGNKATLNGVIPDMDKLDLKGRTVNILFDANVHTNESVRAAREVFARELCRRGAEVYYLELPPECETKGLNGIDDYLGDITLREGADVAISAGIDLLEHARPYKSSNAKTVEPAMQRRQFGPALTEILNHLVPLDFRNAAAAKDDVKVSQKDYRILVIREVLSIAGKLNSPLARNHDFLYAYNGKFWELMDRAEIEAFLGESALACGVPDLVANDYKFKTDLLKQFQADGYLPRPPATESILINLQNGTLMIDGPNISLRPHDQHDFLTYCLGFEYQTAADSPKWNAFLNHVLPESAKQAVLAEYFAYIFVRNLKLEKTLMLYGTGANGKSVVFDVMNALLGTENVSNYSLKSLGDNYFRAMIANKLLNYSSEISNKLQAEKFKQLTSGEPVEARLPYGQPMILKNYARLAFNCNELPREVEHSEAFFRRFLIIPFAVTIPANERNPNLAKDIIAEELPGVLNWVLRGLLRLTSQNGFTDCEAVSDALSNFRRESDSVAMFLADEGYASHATARIALKTFYSEYRTYCIENGYRPLGRNNMAKRLQQSGIYVRRENLGMMVPVWKV